MLLRTLSARVQWLRSFWNFWNAFSSGTAPLVDSLPMLHAFAGTENERLYKAVFRKCEGDASEHLMVTDKKGRIMYLTTQVTSNWNCFLKP
jgi:hypothetical protein